MCQRTHINLRITVAKDANRKELTIHTYQTGKIRLLRYRSENAKRIVRLENMSGYTVNITT